jgi:catechol 2,3-dioxygenase-like lactoylglutathione lyase family enzyme
MTSSATGISKIGQIALPVDDIARATAFYRDVLGMTFLFDAPGMAFFDLSGVRLMLAAPEKPEFRTMASILYYAVEDIEAFCAALDAKKVKFEAKPHAVHKTPEMELWMAFLRDSENNLLALMSEVRSA